MFFLQQTTTSTPELGFHFHFVLIVKKAMTHQSY